MNWIYYLLEVNFYMVFFYAVYYLVLRRDTYYQLNRAYLLVSSLLAFIIPLLQLGFLKPTPVLTEQVMPITDISYLPIEHYVANTVISPLPVAINYYLMTYIGITIVMAVSFGIRLFQLGKLAKKGKIINGKSFHIIEMEDDGRAFSFFNYLFISKKYISSVTIIQHELVHIRQKHSLDIMYVEVLKIICWFNPVVYLMQGSIRELHEYIADSQIAAEQEGVNEYTDFLLSNAYGLNEPLLANNFFNKNLLKNRIMMLHQKRSGTLARLKPLIALPLLTGMLCLSTLAFTKNYHVFDLAPAKAIVIKVKPNKHQNKFKMPQIPIGHGIMFITDKGYKYHQTPYMLSNNNNSDWGVVITEKDGSSKEYFLSTAKAADIKLLNEKYGYIFPEKMVIQSTKKETKSTVLTSNIVYIVNPVGYNYFTFANISTRLYQQGYIMNYREINKGTDSALLEISMETSPQIKWHKKASATFKTAEMGKDAYMIMVGADEAKEQLFVHSVRKSVADSITKVHQPGSIQPKAKVNKVSFPLPAVKADTTNPAIFEPLYNYLGSHIKYPAFARENNIQGKIFAVFNVDDDHKIRNVNIVRGLSNDLDAEILRAIKSVSAPDGLKPGINYAIPFNFVIASSDGSAYIKSTPPFYKSTYISDYKPTAFKSLALSEIVITSFYSNTKK